MKGMKYPPFARPGQAAKPPQRPEVEELPSIDDFLDELPPIDEFLVSESSYAPERFTPLEPQTKVEVQNEIQPEAGWAPGDWQSYDWKSLSRLATPVVPARAIADEPSSSADEVASALEGMARRIRSGELMIDNLHGTPPEAAMAAALAVVLRMRE